MTDEIKSSIDMTTVHSWKDLVGKWLYAQGVGTIFLAAILYAAWEGFPKWNESVRAGYKEMHNGFSEDLKTLTDQMAKDQEKDRQLFERLLQEVRAGRRATEALAPKE